MLVLLSENNAKKRREIRQTTAIQVKRLDGIMTANGTKTAGNLYQAYTQRQKSDKQRQIMQDGVMIKKIKSH